MHGYYSLFLGALFTVNGALVFVAGLLVGLIIGAQHG